MFSQTSDQMASQTGNPTDSQTGNPFDIPADVIKARRREVQEKMRAADEAAGRERIRLYEERYNKLLKKCQDSVIQHIIVGSSIDIEHNKYSNYSTIAGIRLIEAQDEAMASRVERKIVEDLLAAGYTVSHGHYVDYYSK